MQYFQGIAPYLTHPLVLIGFVLLLVFGTHRALLKSGIIKPLSVAASGGVVRLILHYGFALALLLVLLGFGLVYWRERRERAKPRLDRLSAESMLQRNRGNVERCAQRLPHALYLDFVFAAPPMSRLNVDIVVGNKIKSFDIHRSTLYEEGVYPAARMDWEDVRGAAEFGPDATAFVTGRNPSYPRVSVAAPAGKLSLTAPDINGCVIDAIRDGLTEFSGVDPGPTLVHRYITDAGVRASRMFSGWIGQDIASGLHSRDFAGARETLAKALAGC